MGIPIAPYPLLRGLNVLLQAVLQMLSANSLAKFLIHVLLRPPTVHPLRRIIIPHSTKNFISLIVALTIIQTLSAQVQVYVQLPPAGLTLKSQLWNLSLVNADQEMNTRIELTMTDATNNQRVLTAVSRSFLLPKGAKQVQLSDVMPVVYTPGAPGYNINANPDGFLPIGTFHICYAVIRYNNDRTEQISEDCETVEIEPVSPPQLVMPGDSEQVEIPRPLFTWLPPTPFTLFNNLAYDWVLVEVQPMQSTADALQQNIPVLTQLNIAYTSFHYPPSAPQLDSNKLYAWRVTAKNNNAPIANSETWSFRLKQAPLTATTKKTGYYTRLTREENTAYSISDGVFRYEYFNEYNNPDVQVRIIDISSATRRELKLDSTGYAVRLGQNFMELDLRESGLVQKHIYLLELTDVMNGRWYAKFEYRKE